MLETYFSASKMLGHLRSGPSGRYLDDFAAVLERQGYSPATAVRYLRAAAHLGHVMAEGGGGSDDMSRPHDIEWEMAPLRVWGKSRYEVPLPLPQDVGDAIA